MLAANGATGVAVNGVYQNDDAARQFTQAIGKVIRKKLLERLRASPVLGICVDESTDVSVRSHLSIYISYIDKTYSVHCAYLCLKGIGRSSKAEVLHKLLMDALTVGPDVLS